MNCAVFSKDNRTYLVSGQESHSQLYLVEAAVCETNISTKLNSNENNVKNNVKHRKKVEEGKSQSSPNLTSSLKRLTFKIKPSDSIQTDFR